VVFGAAPSPSPFPSTPGTPSIDGGQILNGVWDGVVAFAKHSPVLAFLVVLVALAGMAESMRVAIQTGPKDPNRRFNRSQRAFILDRAGHRCEHDGLFGRCRATQKLEADHIHPHSRGGWTHVDNGQALCKMHNRQKLAVIPYSFQLRRLERRRAAYFPHGMPVTVVRRSKPSKRKTKSEPAEN